MVAIQHLKFREYRDKVSALKIAAEDVKALFTNLPQFSAENKYLLRRGAISQNMSDMMLRGEKRIPHLLKDLIAELDKELASLDKTLGHLSTLSIDAFKQFQHSALSHQKKQNDILKALYEMGVNFFHGVDGQIHARHDTVEMSHNRFREHVYELLNLLLEGNKDKAVIADHWADALEFLVQYARDDSELGLPRHSYRDLIHAEPDRTSKWIMQKYFSAGNGAGYVNQLHKVGYRRPARLDDDESVKVKYIDLSEDNQKKVDDIIKGSLLFLLEGIPPFNSKINRGMIVPWETDGDDESIKGFIEAVYKGDGKISKDQIKMLQQLLVEFRAEVIEGACERYFRFSEGGSDLGYNGFRISQSDWDGGKIITVGKLYDKKFYEEDKNEPLVKSLTLKLKQVLDEDKPEKDAWVISLIEDSENSKLLAKKKDSKKKDDDEKISESEKVEIRNRWSALLAKSGFSSGTPIPFDYSNYQAQLDSLISILGINQFDIEKEGSEYKPSDKFKKVLKGFEKEFEADAKELLKQIKDRGVSPTSAYDIIELIYKVFIGFS